MTTEQQAGRDGWEGRNGFYDPAVDQELWNRGDTASDDQDEAGQGMVEYGLIIMLIAIILVIALQLLGHQTNNLFSNVSNGFNR